QGRCDQGGRQDRPVDQGPSGPAAERSSPAWRRPRARAEAEALHAPVRRAAGRLPSRDREKAQIAGPSDRAAVAAQLGREPTVPFTVVLRCSAGHPLVIRNFPRDADGNPFPTLYWLTCPDHVKAVSTLESHGWIARLNADADTDPDLR